MTAPTTNHHAPDTFGASHFKGVGMTQQQEETYCPEWARCEYCGPMSLEQTAEVQPGLLSHESPSGEIHQVDASLEAGAPQ